MSEQDRRGIVAIDPFEDVKSEPRRRELVGMLRHLVSLDRKENGGLYEGVAARECIRQMERAADEIERLTEALELICDIDDRPFKCAKIAREALR